MSMPQFEKMTPRDLRALRDKIDATISVKQQNAKVELRKMFSTMASEVGMSVHDVLGGIGKSDKPATGERKHKLTPMRNKVTGVVWSGAGRYPFKFDKKRAEPV